MQTSTNLVFFSSLSICYLSGGRLTFCILLISLYALYIHNEGSLKNGTREVPDTPIVSKSKAPMAVDFTNFQPKTKTRAKRIPKIIRAAAPVSNKPKLTQSENLLDSNVIIFYTSLTGASERSANKLFHKLSEVLTNAPKLLNLDNDVDDLDEYFVKTPALNKLIYILILPSYETDSPIDYFLETLLDTYQDFRVDKYPLKKLFGFTMLSIGDSESWPEKFCYQGKLADRYLSKLGARRIFPTGEVCMKTGGDPKVEEWINSFSESLKDDEPLFLDEGYDSDEDGTVVDGGDDELVDVEDMGKMMTRTESNTTNSTTVEVKQMVAKDSPTYKSLTKQGYTVVGSHSGVKICRWTKSALRGRGSCYKFAFYGIRSHLCMETTPSLSCSNKCVFCWRHGTNPVGTSWRWEVDGPEEILKGALEGHYSKIKQMRGVPGVQLDRFNEAFQVKHCALSLVGEPIFYPYINEFVGMLHDRKISSFLVCNAQHPEQLANMHKVTQLYVSIDAATKDDLKRIDRPLFKDYWERLNQCLDILATKQSHQRTVFRLTLVKGFNMNEVEDYAELIRKGNPSQIEIKGATFCGSSSGNGNPLTMQNIPFYEECKQFVTNLNDRLKEIGLDYGIAAEHAHSCCILVASKRFFINDKWYTHIDYPRFFELLESGADFTDLDYIRETPSWAYWGSDEGGFNPDDVKYNRKEEKAKKKMERESETIKNF